LLQWHVTERCNLRCAHCYQEGYSGEELPFQDLLKVLSQYKELLARGRKLGVSRVWSDRVIPWGSGAELRDQVLTPDETREFFHIMHSARTEAARRWFGRTEIAMHRALQFLVAGERPYHCTAGDSLITIQPNGDLYPCRRMPIRVGNVLETPLADLYYQSDLFRALRDRHRASNGCQDCCHGRQCRGGLKCLSYTATGDHFQADPGCWHASDSRRSALP
jgi:radical SAM protein with 4Fe4S-binding SPASM domain